MVERQSCKLKVLGSIPSGGFVRNVRFRDFPPRMHIAPHGTHSCLWHFQLSVRAGTRSPGCFLQGSRAQHCHGTCCQGVKPPPGMCWGGVGEVPVCLAGRVRASWDKVSIAGRSPGCWFLVGVGSDGCPGSGFPEGVVPTSWFEGSGIQCRRKGYRDREPPPLESQAQPEQRECQSVLKLQSVS